MDLIHDRTNKFMNGVRKKKIKVVGNVYKDDKDQIKQDTVPISDISNCFYCEKVFFNSKFLMRHILRRHSEGLVALYKSSLKGESSDNSADMKHLRSYIESQFLSLKNELKVVKQAVAGKSIENDTETGDKSQENACNDRENKIDEDAFALILNEIKNVSERVSDVETSNKSVNNTVKELDNVLKTDVLRKQDMQEHLEINNKKILRIQESQLHEMRQILLKDLQSIVSKQLYDNNNEFKLQFSEVNHVLKQIDYDIAAINKRIDSPDFTKAIEEKYKHQFHVLMSSMKGISRVSNKQKSKPVVNHVAGEKISDNNKANKRLARRKNKQIRMMPQVSPNELAAYMVTEKLSYFDIPTNTSKIPSSVYDEKLKLINIEKEHCSILNSCFFETYNNLNMLADHKVNLELHNRKSHKELHNRKSRKVKFSEPLKSSISAVNNLVSNAENFQNKRYLSETQHSSTVNNPDRECEASVSLRKHEYIPESEGFLAADLNGGGDCFLNYSCQSHCFEEASTVVKSVSEFKSSAAVKEFKNSAIVNSTPKSKITENQTDSLDGTSFTIKSVSEFKNSTTVNSTPKSEKNEIQTDSHEPSSVKTISDFRTSDDSQESKKSEIIDYSENPYSLKPLPTSSKKSFDWESIEMQNSDYTLKYYSGKNIAGKENYVHNYNDYELSMADSLSSLEDYPSDIKDNE